MPISFDQVTATLTQTETEIQEHEAAVQALADARDSLSTAQDVVSAAQATVQAATDAESTEKADVVAGIATAISQLNAILAELQA